MEKSVQMSKFQAYSRLMRIDKPIGTLLLLWPTLWALWLSDMGVPPLSVLVVFVLGVFVMRAAGCVINDFADRKVDGFVKRTAGRPLPSGAVSEKEAKILFVLLGLLAFALVLTMNLMTILLSLGGLALAWCYPFMKRYTHLPQVVLGAAFGWAIPMAWAAVSESLPLECWLVFLANICWTVAYDTQYAMVDRDDDIKIGVKSTAILFGR
ncbi:MAG TPA: 4-hydroxybenzoate octaprenyltransferase, partial [Pantoea sp.]|nr:4-hydroxybenzoate octaprenyltransferase [Pantoea sp.]